MFQDFSNRTVLNGMTCIPGLKRERNSTLIRYAKRLNSFRIEAKVSVLTQTTAWRAVAISSRSLWWTTPSLPNPRMSCTSPTLSADTLCANSEESWRTTSSSDHRQRAPPVWRICSSPLLATSTRALLSLRHVASSNPWSCVTDASSPALAFS